MMRDALITLAAAAVLLSLVELALDLAGRPWRRTSRLRSACLLLFSTGVLSEQLLPASLPWLVSFISPLLVLAAVICTPELVRTRAALDSGVPEPCLIGW